MVSDGEWRRGGPVFSELKPKAVELTRSSQRAVCAENAFQRAHPDFAQMAFTSRHHGLLESVDSSTRCSGHLQGSMYAGCSAKWILLTYRRLFRCVPHTRLIPGGQSLRLRVEAATCQDAFYEIAKSNICETTGNGAHRRSWTIRPPTHTLLTFLSSPFHTHFATLSSQLSHPKISTTPQPSPTSPSPLTDPNSIS